MAQWQKPLERKKLKQLRKKENPPEVQAPLENDKGLITIHDVEKGVELPPHPTKTFAVVDIKGR